MHAEQHPGQSAGAAEAAGYDTNSGTEAEGEQQGKRRKPKKSARRAEAAAALAETQVTGWLVMRLRVSAELAFDVDVRLRFVPTDPYAVELVFHLPGDPPVRWVFARKLLSDGIAGCAGEGDVVVEPEPDGGRFTDADTGAEDGVRGSGTVRISLRSPAGEAVLLSPALPLVAFLGRAERLLPTGQEQTVEALDRQLDLILDGPLRSTD